MAWHYGNKVVQVDLKTLRYPVLYVNLLVGLWLTPAEEEEVRTTATTEAAAIDGDCDLAIRSGGLFYLPFRGQHKKAAAASSSSTKAGGGGGGGPGRLLRPEGRQNRQLHAPPSVRRPRKILRQLEDGRSGRRLGHPEEVQRTRRQATLPVRFDRKDSLFLGIG